MLNQKEINLIGKINEEPPISDLIERQMEIGREQRKITYSFIGGRRVTGGYELIYRILEDESENIYKTINWHQKRALNKLKCLNIKK